MYQIDNKMSSPETHYYIMNTLLMRHLHVVLNTA